ncbi:type IIL restriction-modification enzyme MmeI [Pseudothauera rhizosphaerae]|uniref:type IIL restriction-modification enzyme MmeI n=1 Tax=Pseudothauera rhizosphaerae TaxID=2565932 RepID=UPI001E381395|nr:type IIL restriction-modification enzyme MmeI [Pseudothauera rhizosphaerae]
MFERRVVLRAPDGSASNGFIDLYRRGAFVCEAKQTGRTLDTSGWDKAMLRAHNQADQYVRALPADEGRPPFILVVDVGRNIELYAGFSRSGATYTPFPDPRAHRIRLEDLRRDDIRERLRAVWLDPASLDPARRSARVTRDIAEMVLWIGYLQWHIRSMGQATVPEPMLRDFRNIENRDALIAYEREELVTDEAGRPVTRWDGESYRTSPVTGEPVPDETAQMPLYRYVEPRKAEWPQADHIVGNPPFIGNKRMRAALGDGYVDAVRDTRPEVPESADFVMYWWHIAAETVRAGEAKHFGFITTNSIKQAFNRRVVEAQLRANDPLSIVFAIPDHPWVDAADGAAVRIAMTVGEAGTHDGRILQVREETATDQDEVAVQLQESTGRLFPDLKIGVNVAAVRPLTANSAISNRGVIPHGEGMTVTEEQATALGLGVVAGLDARLRPYRNGRDLTQTPRNVRVIDMHGLSAEQVREQFPAVYQWLSERVKPERDQNKDRDLREKWWLHRRNNEDLRNSMRGINRYVATVQTSKHRLFTFLDVAVLPDDKLIAITMDDSTWLGVLSSRIHVVWALATGATLEDRPVYNKTTCFEAFPFPSIGNDLAASEASREVADRAKSRKSPNRSMPTASASRPNTRN